MTSERARLGISYEFYKTNNLLYYTKLYTNIMQVVLHIIIIICVDKFNSVLLCAVIGILLKRNKQMEN